MNATAIVVLCASICPPAITGLIVPVVIDAIKGFSFRAWTHVFKKGREAVNPSFTHGDSAIQIPGSTMGVRVGNSLLGSDPRFMLHRAGSTMNEISLRGGFSYETSATGRSVEEIVPVYRLLGATVAETNPSGPTVETRFPWCDGFHHKTTEARARLYEFAFVHLQIIQEVPIWP